MTRIALVDDEDNILASVSIALQSEGFDVDTFRNGEEAIIGLEKKKYDLGLFDIKMPRMNGNELLMKVRSSNDLNLRDMPIIFLVFSADSTLITKSGLFSTNSSLPFSIFFKNGSIMFCSIDFPMFFSYERIFPVAGRTFTVKEYTLGSSSRLS